MEFRSGPHTARDGGIRWLYRQGIIACDVEDAMSAKAILLVLVAALDFDYEDAATELFALYERMRKYVEAGRFARTREMFERLGSLAEPRAARG